MDPRRARDPRLARADPRIQRPSPVPTPQPLPPQAQQQLIENGVQVYTTPLPVQNHFQPSQLTVASAPPIQASLHPEYKQKPLFCVVCASNQVSRQCPV